MLLTEEASLGGDFGRDTPPHLATALVSVDLGTKDHGILSANRDELVHIVLIAPLPVVIVTDVTLVDDPRPIERVVGANPGDWVKVLVRVDVLVEGEHVSESGMEVVGVTPGVPLRIPSQVVHGVAEHDKADKSSDDLPRIHYEFVHPWHGGDLVVHDEPEIPPSVRHDRTAQEGPMTQLSSGFSGDGAGRNGLTFELVIGVHVPPVRAVDGGTVVTLCPSAVWFYSANG